MIPESHSKRIIVENDKQSIVKQDALRLIVVSITGMILLLIIMFFSPLSMQFHEGVGRGELNATSFDELIENKDFDGALAIVDSLIVIKREGLPRFPFFDRFLAEEECYHASLARLEIYELQWNRIDLLKAKDDKTALIKELRPYIRIIGYHQEDAQELLKQMEGK